MDKVSFQAHSESSLVAHHYLIMETVHLCWMLTELSHFGNTQLHIRFLWIVSIRKSPRGGGLEYRTNWLRTSFLLTWTLPHPGQTPLKSEMRTLCLMFLYSQPLIMLCLHMLYWRGAPRGCSMELREDGWLQAVASVTTLCWPSKWY